METELSSEAGKSKEYPSVESARSAVEYHDIVARSPVGIAQLDANGVHVMANESYCAMFGRTHAEVLGRELADFAQYVQLNGAGLAKEHPVYEVLRDGARVHAADGVFFRPDGTTFSAEYWIRPIDRDGKVQGAICTVVPLPEREKSSTSPDIKSRELSHRVRNMFAIAQAIVGQTLRNIFVPREIIHAINQRLAALSNANAVLMRTPSGRSSILDIVEAAVAAHRTDPDCIQVRGPDVALGSKAALAITLALHELCTNAAKYGALTTDAGIVLIDWEVANGSAEEAFRMRWEEQDGPVVTSPSQKGFGYRLIVDNIGSDLRGRGELIFDARGVRWILEAPLAALTE